MLCKKIIFLVVLDFELRALHLLGHASKPFLLLDYFSDRVLLFACSSLGPQSSYLCLPLQSVLPSPAYLLAWNLAKFLPRRALNYESHDLFLLSSWDYRHEHPEQCFCLFDSFKSIFFLYFLSSSLLFFWLRNVFSLFKFFPLALQNYKVGFYVFKSFSGNIKVLM
jgi:hypothetical protein